MWHILTIGLCVFFLTWELRSVFGSCQWFAALCAFYPSQRLRVLAFKPRRNGVRILWDISTFAWPTCPVPIRGWCRGSVLCVFWDSCRTYLTIEIFQKVTQSLRYLRGYEFEETEVNRSLLVWHWHRLLPKSGIHVRDWKVGPSFSHRYTCSDFPSRF